MAATEIEQRRLVERAGVALAQAVVDAVPDERGAGEQARGLPDQQQDRHRDPRPIRPQHLDEASQHLARVAPAQRLLDRVLAERAAASAPHCTGSTVTAASMAAACASTSR